MSPSSSLLLTRIMRGVLRDNQGIIFRHDSLDYCSIIGCNNKGEARKKILGEQKKGGIESAFL